MEYRKTDKVTLDHKGYGQRAETSKLIIESAASNDSQLFWEF